jgi:hypothetical protein
MPTYQNMDQSQQQSSMSPATSSPQVDAFQSYRRDSGQVAQYQPSAFATSQIPQYAGYAQSYAQPPAFTSPYQPQQQQNTQQTRQAQGQHHTHAAYAPMHAQPQSYVSNDAQAHDDGDNSDGGVSVPPSY